MQVLLPLHGFIGWNGGLDLIRLILAGLGESDLSSEIKPTLVIPRLALAHRILANLPTSISNLAGRDRTLRAYSKYKLHSMAGNIAVGWDSVSCGRSPLHTVACAEAVGADIIFPSTQVLSDCRVPWVGYIPDFQHVHLPEFFSPDERAHRDSYYSSLATQANGIVVNSMVAADDVHSLLGVQRDRILAMPFAPYASPEHLSLDPRVAQNKYGISNRYLIICNHFWAHKDHATALKAFSMLRRKQGYNDIALVLTGETNDYRDPRHYERIMKLAQDLGIRSHMHVLGLIPKTDQIALLRGALTLVQPTLYEGGPGGGAVYDAIGLGVSCVVSDIKINHEIDGSDVSLFKTGEPYDLYLKLEQVLETQRTPLSPEELISSGHARLVNLGQDICHYLHRRLSDLA